MVLKEKENVSGSMIKLNWAFKIVSLKQNDAIDFFCLLLDSKTTDSSLLLSANESNCKFSGTLEKNKSQ